MSEIEAQLSLLSISEKILLVQDLWDSIVDEDPAELALTSDQLREIETRLRSHHEAPDSAVSWESVRAELTKSES